MNTLLAIEHVDSRVGDLAVHLQHQPELLHRFERRTRRRSIAVTPASECVVAPAG